MGVMTNLLVKDDATSPLELTFTPVTDNPVPVWRGGIAGVPIDGQPRLTMSVEKQKNGVYKVTRKLEVPVMETLGASGTSAGYVASPKVAFVNTDIHTQFIDPRSTLADRANLLKLAMGVDQGASSTTATGILANTAAGDAWKNSVLPGPLLFTGLFLPN